MSARQRTRHRGFSLVEVLTVVAVIGILTAVALPSYQEYVRRGHRAEARAGLLQAAQWMERVATANGVYPATTAKNGADVTPLPLSLTTVPGRRYAVSLKTATDSAYTLIAVPSDAQSDDKCGTFTLDQSSVRGITSAAATGSADLIADCWNR
ncbi:type IV pilin protein [Variovorax sp. PAMC28562]|uniref:type IV pilin protein n=1 Tax=Variovorax sp. PAMC28562 TaxID=2762323 RepID=UPI00164E6C8A|nr:type IV pilin protein [Variovorax sp. PAMC28562]QNK73318.1 type IV pilin protein [Variovorax sp. PAMC28562]